MVSPLVIKYKKELQVNVLPGMQQAVLNYIQTIIAEKKAEQIFVEYEKVSYKGNNLRQSIFNSVEKGTFTILNENNKSYLVYQLKIHNFFIPVTIISTVIGLISQDWWDGIIAFFALGSVIFIVALLRHEILAGNLAVGIDALHGFAVKKEAVNIDGPTKHWF